MRFKKVIKKIYKSIRSKKVSNKIGTCGIGFTAGKGIKIFNGECIEIGKNVNINDYAVFAPLKSYNDKTYNPKIIIGNNVHIGTQNRFGCMDEIKIEDNVLFAAFVHVTDHSHGYEDINISVKKQDIISKGPILIKSNSWLGYGCQIMSGVTIGRNSVVAAGAIVTKDVPDYTIVAGNPAKVIKKYDFDTRSWIGSKS